MNKPVPEFSRIISASRIPPKGVEESLKTSPSERKALAERFDLVELSALSAKLALQQEANKTIAVTGTIEAEIVQTCGVTLEPIKTLLNIDVSLILIPDESDAIPKNPDVFDDVKDEFDFFSGGKIDLGELVSQQLGVMIDPYPRKEGAALTKTEFGGKDETPHPFTILSKIVENKRD